MTSTPPSQTGWSLGRWYFGLPINWRFMVPSAVVLGAISLIFLLYMPYKVQTQALSELEVRSQATGKMMAPQLVPMIAYQDANAAQQLLQRAADGNKDLRFGVVTSASGSVFTVLNSAYADKHHAMRFLARPIRSRTGDAFKRDGVEYLYKTELRDPANKDAQGHDTLVGYMALGFNLAEVDQQVATSRMVALGIAAVMFIFSFAVTFGVSNAMARALKDIVKACDLLSEGDLDAVEALIPKQKVHAGGNEFARMQNAFREVVDYISDMAEHAESVAKGDLTRNVQARGQRDQLGNSIGAMVSSLRQVVGRVRSVAQLVGHAASTIKTSSSKIASTSHSHAAATEETLSSMEEMAASAQEVAASVEQASQAAAKVDEEAKQGGEAVAETVSGMAGINSAIDELSVVIHRLDERSQQIGSIIQIIKTIAEKTNLLALNAAIEAARAGDSGRGFAVVADEVRKLAEQSGKATKEIGDLIAAIQAEVERAVRAHQEGSRANTVGLEKASKAGATLEQIQNAVAHAARMMFEISAVTGQQSEASGQILRATEQMAEFNGQVNEAMRVMTDDAQALDSQARDLLELVSFFRDAEDEGWHDAQVPSSKTLVIRTQLQTH